MTLSYGFVCFCQFVVSGCWLLTYSTRNSQNHSWRFHRVYFTWKLCESAWNLYRHTLAHHTTPHILFFEKYNIIFIGHSHLKCWRIEGLANFIAVCYLSYRVCIDGCRIYYTMSNGSNWMEWARLNYAHIPKKKGGKTKVRRYNRVKMDWSLGRMKMMRHVTHIKCILYTHTRSVWCSMLAFTAIEFYSLAKRCSLVFILFYFNYTQAENW